jgi:hypothetical protein
VLVADDGTGRRTLDVDGFSLKDLGGPSCEKIELERRWVEARRPRDGGGGASPNMKNLMKAPISSTTDSWPNKNPCVNDRLSQLAT